jgi:hypothetical protein
VTRRLTIVVGSIAGVIAGTAASLMSARVVTAYGRSASKSSEAQSQPALSPREQQERHLADFQNAPLDPRWSTPAVAALRDYFEAIAKRGARARVVHADCRSRTCLAELQWDKLEQAQADSQKVAMVFAPALSGCTAEIYLPPSDASPYRASLTLTGCQ